MFCGQCGENIDDDSKFCRHCGAAQGKTPEPATVISSPAKAPGPPPPVEPIGKSLAAVGVGLGVIVITVLIASTLETKKDAAPQAGSSPAAIVATPAATPEPPKPVENWAYSEDADKVRGKTTYYARTTSTNTVHQDPPYDPATTMEIVVRKSPAYGTDVMFIISSGQMMCPSYDGCSATVSFDGGAPQRVGLNGPSDNSSETVFVEGAKAFIAKLRKAKKVVVEKTLYQAGNPQFEFDVAGLKWEY